MALILVMYLRANIMSYSLQGVMAEHAHVRRKYLCTNMCSRSLYTHMAGTCVCLGRNFVLRLAMGKAKVSCWFLYGMCSGGARMEGVSHL
jgi:hypothetical protein